MSSVNDFLTKRLKNKINSPKTTQLAKASANGQLSSFSGLFNINDLSSQEKETIENILLDYSTQKSTLHKDLQALITLSSEVKAINNQAALLHGERIKQAQSILKKYREGAFTAWLLAAYGNRQTPYNFLQYFEFCSALPKSLRGKVEIMPRQAVYSLASREGPTKKKEDLVRSYAGETKAEILQQIRELFPLPQTDKRKHDVGDQIIQSLKKTIQLFSHNQLKLTKTQKSSILRFLKIMETSL